MAVATRLNDIPSDAEAFGFRISTFGTILGRSIMLADLVQLLGACPSSARVEEYESAAVDQNVLGKPTASARKFGFRNLREFYALDLGVVIFRALRSLWDADPRAQPMLALLCATARDPILRTLTPFVLSVLPGAGLQPLMVSDEADRRFPGKFSPNPLRSLGRNAASSWEQAGLLYGARDKERVRPQARPASVAYALLLADLCGSRGRGLFDTLWLRMFDTPIENLREQAIAASRQGWLEYRSSGDVIEVTFRHLMPERWNGSG